MTSPQPQPQESKIKIPVPFEQLTRGFKIVPGLRQVGGGYRCASWPDPRAMDMRDKAALYELITEMASITFASDLTQFWGDRAKNGYLDKIAKMVLIVDSQGDVVGWSSYHRLIIEGTRCVYIDSTGMLPGRQSSGVMSKVMSRFLLEELVRNKLAPVYLGMRTENPIVYYSFYRALGMENMYPNLEAPPPPTVVTLGKYIARWLNQEQKFEPAALRINGAYANVNVMYGEEAPASPDERINQYFRTHLRRQDAFIILGRLSPAGIIKAFRLNTMARRRSQTERK